MKKEIKNEEVQLTIDDIETVEEVTEEVVEEVTEEVVEAVVEAIVEEAEETGKTVEEVVEEIVEETTEEVIEEATKEIYDVTELLEEETQNDLEETIEDEIVEGELNGCTKLNVRAEASKDSAVVCVIDKDTSFTVNLTASTEDFYKIHTCVNEVLYEGFCVKQFINIK